MKNLNKILFSGIIAVASLTACEEDIKVSDISYSPVYHLTELKAVTSGAKPDHRITCFKEKDVVLIWKDNKAVKSYKPIDYLDESTDIGYDLSFMITKDTTVYNYDVVSEEEVKTKVFVKVQEFDTETQELVGTPIEFTAKIAEDKQLIENN